MPATYPVYTLPDWLTDENRLRDEAVLFGLVADHPDEKTEQIRLAFAALTAPLTAQISQHRQAISTLDAQLDRVEGQLRTLPDAVTGLGGAGANTGWFNRLSWWPAGRLVLGWVLTIGLTVGTYSGTFALTNVPELALLLAGLTSLLGVVGTLVSYQTAYRNQLTKSRLLRDKQEAARTRWLTEQRLFQQQKQAQIEQLHQADAVLAQQQAHRDQLASSFESEFELARSLRHLFQPSYAPI